MVKLHCSEFLTGFLMFVKRWTTVIAARRGDNA